MSNTEFDLRLDKKQFVALAGCAKGLFEHRREIDPHYKTAAGRACLIWQQYLTNAMLEAASIAQGKKTRTARRRHKHLKELEALLGHYPNEGDIREALSRGGGNEESLVSEIIADVQRLKQQPPPVRRRSSMEVLEEKVRKLTAKRSATKKGTSVKRSRK